MPKIIQPLSDPDEIRRQAADATKEQYTDYYVNAPAPDPLEFHSPVQNVSEQPTEAELSEQNDPLKDFE